MIKRVFRLVGVLALAGLLLAGALTLTQGGPVQAAPQAALGDESVLVPFAGLRGYTATTTSTPQSLVGYEYLVIQVAGAVSATGPITIVPQMSNYNGSNCSNTPAGAWFTPTLYSQVVYSPYTSLSWVTSEITFIVASGGPAVARGVPNLGRCVRVLANSSSDLFTPTVYIKLLDEALPEQ